MEQGPKRGPEALRYRTAPAPTAAVTWDGLPAHRNARVRDFLVAQGDRLEDLICGMPTRNEAPFLQGHVWRKDFVLG